MGLQSLPAWFVQAKSNVMKKHLNILSLLVLVVYGTLALVAVPLHHHTIEYVDSPQYQSVTAHHGVDCDVCTFASSSFTISTSSGLCTKLVDTPDKPFVVELANGFTSLLSKEYPRRGPPAFLA